MDFGIFVEEQMARGGVIERLGRRARAIA